jgi:hypothetical protein
VLRDDTSIANRELILLGHGYSGEEEIYLGFYTYQNAGADWYSLCVTAALWNAALAAGWEQAATNVLRKNGGIKHLR